MAEQDTNESTSQQAAPAAEERKQDVQTEPQVDAREDVNPQGGSRVERRSGGQGEVRSQNDRRLQDNLDPEKRREIGRKGGEAVSRNREHMAAIGRKGGVAVSKNREHMAAIGREGGRS